MNTHLRPDVLALVEDAARRHGLDFWLLVAQVERESSGEPRAYRLEPRYRWFYPPGSMPTGDELEFQRTSWGLLQIMGATARELGYRVPAAVWPESPLRSDAAAALDLGCLYLKKQMRRWPSISDVLSAYNAGHPTRENFGEYVDPILERADALREAAG